MPRPRFDLADRLEHQAGNVENDGHLNAARYMREAAAAITAYLAQAGKEGWVMVPKEASKEVVNAALDKHAEITPCESPFGPDGYFALLYRAMVAAAQNEGE